MVGAGNSIFSLNWTGLLMSAARHSITRRAIAKGLLAALAVLNSKNTLRSAQERKRPYFMPPSEREFLGELILKQPCQDGLRANENCRLKRRWLRWCIPLR